MKDAYYFSHDSNARNDPKCAALRSKYGSQGYGWFWIIIELLRDQPNYRYPYNKYTFDTLAREMQCERNAVAEFINDCCHEFADKDNSLLCMDDNYIWSESLIRRMEEVGRKSENARKASNIRWSKKECKSNADAMQMQCDSNPIKERKGKEKKVKNIYSEFVSMTDDEYKKLIDSYGESNTEKMIETLNNYKGSSGKKYKSDYLAVLNWVVERVMGKDNKQNTSTKYKDMSDYNLEEGG